MSTQTSAAWGGPDRLLDSLAAEARARAAWRRRYGRGQPARIYLLAYVARALAVGVPS